MEILKWLKSKWDNLVFNLHPKCPKYNGRVYYVGEDWSGRIWLSIYECENCKTQYI